MGKYEGFSKVRLTRPQRSTFDLSHKKRYSFKAGILYPVLVTECVPSDSFYGSSEVLLRLAPLLAPIYDVLRVYVHFYFVPNRLLWREWGNFITGGRLGPGSSDPGPENEPIPPWVDMKKLGTAFGGGVASISLPGYLGVPSYPNAPDVLDDYEGIELDAMPMLAYQLIWFEYYRDRNFSSDVFWVQPFDSGEIDPSVADNTDYFVLRNRCWGHDYFTSALPWAQRGAEVMIPIGDGVVTYLQQSRVVNANTDALISTNTILLNTEDTPTYPPGSLQVATAQGFDANPARIENIENINNLSTTISDFQAAYALQVWMQRNAIAGSRYNESTEAHFGVRTQDSRLQRPEYIGGGLITVNISEVVSTSWSINELTESVVPQANMAGHGVTFGDTNQFKYFCTEHGFIMGILSIMPEATYFQGLPRMFRRRSFLDYPWPTFAKLGEQTVDKYEIFMSAATLTPDEVTGEMPVFGYQSRYADWKYICNSNHGTFRYSQLHWTCARFFEDEPELGLTFLEVDAPSSVNRIFAVEPGEDPFWAYIFNKVKVKRPLPYFGTPNTLGFV